LPLKTNFDNTFLHLQYLIFVSVHYLQFTAKFARHCFSCTPPPCLHATTLCVLHHFIGTPLLCVHFILSTHLCSVCMPLFYMHFTTLFELHFFVYPLQSCLYATVLSARCCLVCLTLLYVYVPACLHLSSLYSAPSLPTYMHATASSWAQVYTGKFLQNAHVGRS
jgi:hypothetical protein